MPKDIKKVSEPKSLKKEKPASNWSVIWRQALPICILLLALFILLGRFNIGGWLPANLYLVLSKMFGWLSWTLLPLLLTYLAVIKLLALEDKISKTRLIGAISKLIIFSAILHLFVGQDQAWSEAQAANYGGYIGYYLSSWLLGPFNVLTSLLFLILASIIATLTIMDITFKQFFDFLKNLWQKFFAPSKKQPPTIKPKAKKADPKLAPDVVERKNPTAIKIPPLKKKTVLTAAADPSWKLPSLDLLDRAEDKADGGDVQTNSETIRETLANFNIDVEMEDAHVGPRVTQYTLRPPSGIKLTKISGLESNIALDLAASSIRIEAPIPGQKVVGIEVPNRRPATVRLSNLLATSEWQMAKPQTLAFCIGQGITGQPEIAYLEQMPHLLVAGQTGSGKSVAINVLLTSLLYRNSPSDLKLILVDPKQVELGLYDHIPHLLTPVIKTPEKCISALKWTVAEMERRLQTFAKASKRNIKEYNSLKEEPHMPFIVVVIDELADLMMVASRDVETLVVRIAQKARAAGIHLVLATQRPSVDVITGLIKANVPGRLAFTVASQVDSRTILDQVGAEKLLGSGDILYINSSLPKPKRLQGAFITDQETAKICDFLRDQGEVKYDSEVVSQEVVISGGRNQILSSSEGDDDDQLYRQAIETVIKAQKASTSLLQRHLRIGYARAARLIESLEEQGIIGPADGSRPRDVLISSLPEEETTDEDEEGI